MREQAYIKVNILENTPSWRSKQGQKNPWGEQTSAQDHTDY